MEKKRPSPKNLSKRYVKGSDLFDKVAREQKVLKRVSLHLSDEPESGVQEVIDRATEVIGNREDAMRWLGTPVRGLDFATPISLLTTEEGAERVNDILGQMEHGIW